MTAGTRGLPTGESTDVTRFTRPRVRGSSDCFSDREGFPCQSTSPDVTSVEPTPAVETDHLTSQGYHITVDDGRDSFFALSIEADDSDDAWLMSDTVRALDEMR